MRKNMSVLIATVGGTENVVKLGFRMMENVEKVILIPGKPFEQVMEKSEIKREKVRADPVQKAYELKKSLEDFGAKVEIEPVNPLDFKECLVKIIKLIHEHIGRNDIVVNVTGGTKPMSLAAMNAACMCSCKAFYVQEKDTGDIKVDLPISSPNYINGKYGSQAEKILAYLLEKQIRLEKPVEEYNDEELANFVSGSIARGIDVEPNSITNKLQMMEADGLIKSKRGSLKRMKSEKNTYGIGKSSVKFCWLTDEGWIYATYFSSRKS
jgi:CRISPR-associated protein Csa3